MDHFLGILKVIIVLVIIGIDASINGDSSKRENTLFKLFLVALSQIFSCFHFITEEKLLKGNETLPLKEVGLEEMWDVLCYIALFYYLFFVLLGVKIGQIF